MTNPDVGILCHIPDRVDALRVNGTAPGPRRPFLEEMTVKAAAS